jgi:hypothetical protein
VTDCARKLRTLRTLCFCTRDPPRLSSIPWGSSCGSVRVAIFNCQTLLPFPRARRHRETVRAARTPRAPSPSARNLKSKSESYAEIDTDSLGTRLSSVGRHFDRAGDRPRLSSIPWASVVRTTRCRSQHLIVRRMLLLPRARPSNRETVRAARTPPHRHHPPRIKNCQSESYAEIDTDSLCTRLSSVGRHFDFAPETHPACPAYPGGPVVARSGSEHLTVRRCYRSLTLASNRETVRAARTPRAPSPSAGF